MVRKSGLRLHIGRIERATALASALIGAVILSCLKPELPQSLRNMARKRPSRATCRPLAGEVGQKAQVASAGGV